jgi:hypothetical protein
MQKTSPTQLCLMLLSIFKFGCGNESESALDKDTAAARATPTTSAAVAGRNSASPVTNVPSSSAMAGAGAAGKAGSGDADTGPSTANTQGAAGAAAISGGATLTQVYEMVYTPSCAVCHSMAPNDSMNGMLGMIRSKDQFYNALVNKPAQGTACSSKGTYVVPGEPDSSLLVQKLSAAPGCGVSMPLGGMLQPMHATLMGDWIASGAKND